MKNFPNIKIMVNNKKWTSSGRKVVKKSREFANKRALSSLMVSNKPRKNFLNIMKKKKIKLVKKKKIKLMKKKKIKLVIL